MMKPVHIIGGGLAGCEAAWQIAQAHIPVILYEMRPFCMTDAHKSDNLAELVCSNSFRSNDYLKSAIGLLQEEMRIAHSLIIETGYESRVPAGSALAVDREQFSIKITEKISSHPFISIQREEIKEPLVEKWDNTIIATGPLTSPALSAWIQEKTNHTGLAFFDAIAPIVYFDTIDMNICWFQSRYDKKGPGGTGKDYINCPLNKEEYQEFIDSLLAAETISFKEWEKTPFFEGCLPIEIMAKRGFETLRYGPMKPVGLTNAHHPEINPYAVVQLRQDNALGTLYNMVGFQTKLKHLEQKNIFRTIPGLKQAEFARLGGMHRNTYINSPAFLDETLQLKTTNKIRLAGQITGCEGYIESAAIGLLAGLFTKKEKLQEKISLPPLSTACGSLLHYITKGHVLSKQDKQSFQPMNINFGLFPPFPSKEKIGTQEKRKNIATQACKDWEEWLSQ